MKKGANSMFLADIQFKKKKKKTSKSQTKAPHKMKLSETIMKTQPKEKYSPRDYTIRYNLNSP